MMFGYALNAMVEGVNLDDERLSEAKSSRAVATATAEDPI